MKRRDINDTSEFTPADHQLKEELNRLAAKMVKEDDKRVKTVKTK